MEQINSDNQVSHVVTVTRVVKQGESLPEEFQELYSQRVVMPCYNEEEIVREVIEAINPGINNSVKISDLEQSNDMLRISVHKHQNKIREQREELEKYRKKNNPAEEANQGTKN